MGWVHTPPPIPAGKRKLWKQDLLLEDDSPACHREGSRRMGGLPGRVAFVDHRFRLTGVVTLAIFGMSGGVSGMALRLDPKLH